MRRRWDSPPSYTPPTRESNCVTSARLRVSRLKRPRFKGASGDTHSTLTKARVLISCAAFALPLTAEQLSVGSGTVQRIKREMEATGPFENAEAA